MMINNLIILTILLALSAPSHAEQNSVSLQVEKMNCPSCPFMIKRALERLDGVESASVSIDSKLAVIKYDDEKATAQDFIETITELGFPSNEVQD